jgi:hypothetical protein
MVHVCASGNRLIIANYKKAYGARGCEAPFMR